MKNSGAGCLRVAGGAMVGELEPTLAVAVVISDGFIHVTWAVAASGCYFMIYSDKSLRLAGCAIVYV